MGCKYRPADGWKNNVRNDEVLVVGPEDMGDHSKSGGASGGGDAA